MREWNEIYCVLGPIIRSLSCMCVRAHIELYRLTGSYASNGVTALGLVLIRQRNGDDLRQKYLRSGEENTRGAILLKVKSILETRTEIYLFSSRNKREGRANLSRNYYHRQILTRRTF